MKNVERLVVATSLVVALTSLALHVAPRNQAMATASVALANDLGPADALVLNDAKGASTDPATLRLTVQAPGYQGWESEIRPADGDAPIKARLRREP